MARNAKKAARTKQRRKKTAKSKNANQNNGKADKAGRLFVEEYLANGRNATQAYLKFHPKVCTKSAETLGARLLGKVGVAAYLAEREEQIKAKYRLTTDDLMRSMSQVIHFDARKLYNEDGTLKKITELDEDTVMALAAVEVVEALGKDSSVVVTKKIKWLDKTAAREQAMKHLGMFKDQLPQPPAPNVTVNVNLSPEEIYQRMCNGTGI